MSTKRHGATKQGIKPSVLLHGNLTDAALDALAKKKVGQVFLVEGRPGLKAAQAASRRLLKRKIKPVVVADNMMGFLFARGLVQEVWWPYRVGSDEGIVGDIGALIAGVLAKRHKVPFYGFPAREKTGFVGKAKELLYFANKQVVPGTLKAYVPLTEWLPGKYITKVK